MDGNNNVRPWAARRTSDPSLEDMLRRARDARLGDAADETALSRPFSEISQPAATPVRAHPVIGGWVLMLVGVLIGLLLSYGVGQLSHAPDDAAPQPSSPIVVQSTDTALPTPTDTPIPLPSIQDIVALAQAYYDTTPPFAGSYVLIGITGIDVQRQDDSHLTACIAYEVGTATSPATLAGGNTRLFTLAVASDGSWRVVQLGAPDSCSLG